MSYLDIVDCRMGIQFGGRNKLDMLSFSNDLEGMWQINRFKKFLYISYKIILSNNPFINLKVKVKNSEYWRSFSLAFLKIKWNLVYHSRYQTVPLTYFLTHYLSFNLQSVGWNQEIVSLYWLSKTGKCIFIHKLSESSASL